VEADDAVKDFTKPDWRKLDSSDAPPFVPVYTREETLGEGRVSHICKSPSSTNDNSAASFADSYCCIPEVVDDYNQNMNGAWIDLIS
jgi:hypothetical protein